MPFFGLNSFKNQGPPGTGKTMTTAVLATCFAADNMSSGSIKGWFFVSSQVAHQNLSKFVVNNEMFWLVLFVFSCQTWNISVGDFEDSLIWRHYYIIWMKMKKWTILVPPEFFSVPPEAHLDLSFSKKANILKGGPDTRMFVSSEGEGWLGLSKEKANGEGDAFDWPPSPVVLFVFFFKLWLRFVFKFLFSFVNHSSLQIISSARGRQALSANLYTRIWKSDNPRPHSTIERTLMSQEVSKG